MRRAHWALILGALILAACGPGAGAVAQPDDKKAKDAPAAAEEPAPPATPETPPPGESPSTVRPGETQAQANARAGIPDPYKLNLMIRTTVIAVNQANKTGNYSVLRDLGAPAFQSANNPAQLAEIFADLRKRNLDLSPVLFYQPKFASRPALLANGMLRIAGLFPSRPQQVHFDLIFEKIDGDWRLHGLGIGAASPPAPEGQSGAKEGAAAEAAPPMAVANMSQPAKQGAGNAPAEKGSAPADKANAPAKPQGRLPPSEGDKGTVR